MPHSPWPLLCALSVLPACSDEPQAYVASGTQGYGPDTMGQDVSDYLIHPALTSCDHVTARAPQRLRIATWNIKAARDSSVEELAAQLAQMDADVVVLQEVDVQVARTGLRDEPAALAALLGEDYIFSASIKFDGGDYGIGMLTRWPVQSVTRHRLSLEGAAEQHTALDVTVCVPGGPIRIVNHHADYLASHPQGLEALEIVRDSLGGRVVLLGDFNLQPDAPEIAQIIAAGLTDSFAENPSPTWSDRRIDYIFTAPAITALVENPQVWVSALSDHQALSVDLGM